MIKYRGFLALLLVLATGALYSPHLLPAAGFTEIADQADRLNDAGRVSEAHQEYLKALPLATERIDRIRALGSLAVTSYGLDKLQDSRQYTRMLLELAPNNKWAGEWLTKVEARLATAAPAAKPAVPKPEPVKPAPVEAPVVAKPTAPEAPATPKPVPPVVAKPAPTAPPAPAKPAPEEKPVAAPPTPEEKPAPAKPAPEPTASAPAGGGDPRKLVKDFPNWYRFGPKPDKPAVPYEDTVKQPETTAAVKPETPPAPEPAQAEVETARAEPPTPEPVPDKQVEPVVAPTPPVAPAPAPEAKEEEPGLLDTFAKWFGLGPETPPQTTPAPAPAPAPVPAPASQPKPAPVPETKVASLPEIPGVRWLPHEKGLEVGRREKEDVLIVFSGNNCHWCEKMNADTFSNQSVAKYMTDNFVLVRVNTDQEKELAKSYRVRGIPTSMFVSADGQQIGPYSGYIPPSSFLAILKSVKSRAYKK